MLTSQADEDSESIEQVIENVLQPFLESVQCPDDLIQQAEQIVADILRVETVTVSAGEDGTARKLLQGIVSMSNGLGTNDENEARQLASLWGTDQGVKAMANNIIDAQNDKSSARDKRKARKADAESARKLLQSKKDVDPDQELSGGLVKMSYVARTGNSGVNKKRDVLVRNVTVALPNGTALLENGELKFAYQRRYGLIGENGVGKSSLLKAINGQEIEGFPTHLRVLHVRQEVPSHFTKDLTVMDAVLQADVERIELLEAEKAIIAKLEQGNNGGDEPLSIEEKRQRFLDKKDDIKEMDADLKSLDDIYARLQLLGSDNADARAAMILAGLQFSPERQHALVSSLSGGWKMRVALAAALFVEPDVCMVC
jgi:ATP-binding cassette subfamily F protein 3